MNVLRVVSDKMYPYSNIEPIPKGQIEFSKIRFILSDDWDDRSIIVQFVQGETPLNRGLENGSCFVPSELQIGEVTVYLKGYSISGESLATVNGVTIPIVQGGVDGGEPSVPPGPDLYQLLLKELNESEANAKDYSNKAVEAAGKAETAAIRQPYPNEETGTWWVWDAETGAYTDTGISYGTGAGGVTEHEKLSGRDKANQHPMSAITGLEDALAGKQPTGAYLTEETDPTVPDWAKEPTKPGYTASEVGADPSGTASSQVSAHNAGKDTHSDIRLLIQGLTERLNALADSDDTTLDQLSEVVAYIKSNRDLIAAVTTDKVSVGDIIDNLTTNVTNKPLSAAQGVVLKALIDAIIIPDKLPNPNALTFTGAVSGSYDGSAPLEVEIPSGGGGLTVTNTAVVGQTVKIAAVDENGQPTEWEAVDMPSGGGGTTSDEWIDLGTLTLADGEEAINFSWKVNGQVKKIHIEGVYYSATSGKSLTLLNNNGLSSIYRDPLITYSVLPFPTSAEKAMYMDLTVEELYPGYWFGFGGSSEYNNSHERTIYSYQKPKRVDSYISLGEYWRSIPLTAGTWFNVKVVYY